MEKLVNLCKTTYDSSSWPDESKKAFEELFGSSTGRYESKAKNTVQLRTPDFKGGPGIVFSALINQENPTSGGYGGTSFVLFPVENDFPLIALGVGTNGLSPDEQILGKPGHSRKVNAICKWLNSEYGNGKIIAWAKQDAVRIDKDIPENIKQLFNSYGDVFSRYGYVLYGFCKPNNENIDIVLKVFLDIFFEEKGYLPLKNYQNEFNEIKTNYFNYLMPSLDQSMVSTLLSERKYVIIQGPPGTGKTKLSQDLLKDKEYYNSNGFSIQFHPNTSYENFIGGLFPITSKSEELGLSFALKEGDLLRAIKEAKKNESKNFLMVIDEINRADLSKVLGEAIFCFEPYDDREIKLNYDYGENIGDKLSLPKNLHILGTMNTADRSIAILDIAIRRRFAFINLWPQLNVVLEKGNKTTIELFKNLLSIFIEYASEESFVLMPGHSYFLEYPSVNSIHFLKTNLVPLLKEYLYQGYVNSFSDSIHSYIQEIESLK
jgi:5-methylcytosine-specific restriction enzyme B